MKVDIQMICHKLEEFPDGIFKKMTSKCTQESLHLLRGLM